MHPRGVSAGRPTDAERARYHEAVDAARAQGKLDDTEWSRRRERINRAMSRAELDGVVTDLPNELRHRRRSSTGKGWLVTLLVAVVAGVLGAGLLAGSRSSDPDAASGSRGDAPVVAEPDAAVEVPEMFTLGMMEALFAKLDDEGVPGYRSIDIWPARARFEVQVAPEARQFDVIDFADGVLGEREPGRELSSSDDPSDVFFATAEIGPGVIAATAARAAEVAGLQDRPVSHISIGRDSSWGGIVTVAVYLEADDYGSSARLVWDGTGQHLLRDGS